MHRLSLLACCVVCGVAALVIAAKRAESGAADAIVRLQQSTPGIQQVGHSNISGTSIAGQHQGGGGGLTNLNASNIATGTLADTRLSLNVALLSGTQTFSGAKTFALSPSFTAATPFSVTGTGNVVNLSADLLDGLDSTAFLQSIPVPLTLTGNTPANIILGQNSSTGAGSSGVAGTSTAVTGTTYGGRFTSNSTDGRGVLGHSTAASGTTYGVWGLNSSTSGRGVFGEASAATGTNYGVYGTTASTVGRGVFGEATATTGANYGVHGTTASTTGRGVFGEATAASGNSTGGRFESDSTSGTGAYGLATAVTGTTYGGFFQSTSATGYGVYGYAPNTTGANFGVYGLSRGSDGTGVFGQAASSSGTTEGGHFESFSTSGMGVTGYANAGSGSTYGVFGVSSSVSGRGVYGVAESGSGTQYGVRGRSNSPSGYGVYADGDLGASGVKSFRIDHPFDPENKYLLHYSTESPFPQNFYSGNIITDAKGYAWVQLPDYFDEINTEYKYQLTVISEDFVQAVVSKKIVANRFQIRTSAPKTEVSWRVEANRNDLRIRANRPTDVREKSGPEKGKYQHPEYYGLGPDRGMDYDPVRQ